MIWFLIFLFSCLGGWLSRMCGGGWPRLPWGMDQWLYGIPYLLIGAPVFFAASGFRRRAFMSAFIASYISAVTGKRTGHGGGIDLNHSPKEPEDGSRTIEKVEYLIIGLHGKIPGYWYDALLLALTGLIVTVPAGIAVAFISPIWGVFLALSGLTKPLGYMIGWGLHPFTKNIKGFPVPTATGEILTGFFGYAAIGITAAMMYASKWSS